VEGSNTAVTTAKPVKFAENEPRRFKPGAVSVG